MTGSTATNYNGAVAIIGITGRFPDARDVAAFWQNLVAGVRSIRSFTDAELLAAGVDPEVLNDPNFVKHGTRLDDIDLFDASFFGYTPREAEVMDPQHRLFLECAWQALEQGGYDPEGFRGAIGVFAGSATSTYRGNNLHTNREIAEAAGGLQLAVGNDVDSLASTVSYKLNLRGPSVAVQTFCSTSLVAVHMACQSLLTYECGLALAGGAVIAVPQGEGYMYQEGGILSPDGHCRTFDAKAQGSVMSNGVGVVLLKRMTDALKDGDTIYAVIRGSAINNDGIRKVGYTAPGLNGQSSVITIAQSRAKVAPETVSYIEAHGTATPLGDSIELAALIKAFDRGAPRKQSCALGSVKPNMGHLDRASGVTGLIKTTMALYHRQLPPNLDFEAPSPDIDLANSPFYVNTQLREWPANGDAPRRAGVNSFGLGGTNVHVVLEEAPAPTPVAPARPAQLLVLSAKTATALEAMTDNLAVYLAGAPADLADVAFTLQVGRTGFNHRRIVAGTSAADVRAALEQRDERRVLTSEQTGRNRPVAFVFPGVGDHYAGMAGTLYATEAVFREAVDQCAELLVSHLGHDLRAALYPADQPAAVAAHTLFAATAASDHVAGALHQTALAQPAVFVVEYALVQLLASWGIRPQALLGYSLGEYVAATVAGVLNLEDALTLVAMRAQWIQSQPHGAMLAVSLGVEAIQPYLNTEVALAVVNSPMTCVLAGPHAALEVVKIHLDGDAVASRWLETSHAFHSPMLAPVAAELTALVGTLRLQIPKIPYISNVTGTWITDAQATDPGYWARHMVETVQFADGVGTLLADAQLALLEVGPGQALGSFIRQHPACGRARFSQIVATLPGATEPQRDLTALLEGLGRLWLAGVPVDWVGFHGGAARQRVPLPTYPFERKRFWIDAPKREWAAANQPATAGKRADIADWFYRPEWAPAALNAPTNDSKQRWLIFADALGIGAGVRQRLVEHGHEAVTVTIGEGFKRLDTHHYEVAPTRLADYLDLIAAIQGQGPLPTHVLHLWSLTPLAAIKGGAARFAAAQDYCFTSLLNLARAFEAQVITDSIHMLVVSKGMQAVEPSDIPDADNATLLGACTVIGQENTSIIVRSVDLDVELDASRSDGYAAELIAEGQSGSHDLHVAYRGAQRFAERYVPLRLEVLTQPILRPGGVYLMTGGLGGVGLVLAEHLARTAQARLVLVGRQGLPERAVWDAWLSEHGADDATSQRIQRVRTIEAAGGAVEVVAADVADPEQMRRAVATAEARFGPINGVLHAAGISDDTAFRLIQTLEQATYAAHFQPKVYGLYALEAALGDRPLDFCVLCSSVSSVLGGLGFAGYAAANCFIDAFTQRHNRTHAVPWVSVNWDTWHLRAGQHDVTGLTVAQYEMSPAEGAAAFERVAAARGHSQIVNSTGDLDARIRQWVRLESIRNDAAVAPAPAINARPELSTTYVAPIGEYEQRVSAIWQHVLGIDEIGLHDNFFDLGGNSLIALQLIARLKKEFKTHISAVALFEAPTVSTMAQYLRPEVAPEEQADQERLLIERRREQTRQTVQADGIAIIGMVGRFPGASSVEELWQNLHTGVESTTHFTDAELLAAGVDPMQVHHPDYVKSRPILQEDITLFDAAFFGYTPREAEFLDPQQRLFHECAWEALEQAGYDTQRYPGLVGVFGGTNTNAYLNRIARDPRSDGHITEIITLENDKDALATNVAYKLNLRGPSFAVQTFCSTSLVATHLACRSLRHGECDIALAGGVSVRVPVNTGYLYEEGDQVSPDGHCRTFDANAGGATFGDGVAIVVLKRLADALADGDTIHAVIRGSAINNDGGLKVGYTAPSVVGQAAVVQAALADANLAADAISYVEAHGTATKLGDPIEVASLTKAYRTMTDKVGFCAISSVKPNIGHLDRASGATGLIKTVMALKHNVIPPTLHFQAPNPEIDFASSPFFVPTALTPWTRNGTPRRAGVNSLGVGGTNAHVIVEEAPLVGPSGPGRAVELLVLSAKTATALEAASANLATYLEGQPTVQLADVAHTLQVGRRVFEHRRVVVARDATSAAGLLRSGDARRVLTLVQKPSSRGVAFVFPGVGDHYVGMAEGLYATEGVFRATVDRCCALLAPLLGSPIRKEIYPDGGAPAQTGVDLRALLREDATPGSAGRLHQTAWAQPAVFVVEYALAQLLASWGIRPQALLGYSLGEYVAATVAGVLSLEDALTVVAKRAQWIQAQPAGSMLAVSLGVEAIGAYVGGEVALAVVNSPMTCVLAGPQSALAALAETLTADEVAYRWLETSHAFHSPMLAPVQAELTALVRTLRLQAPRIPYISNVTGTWITDAEATDPGYWARHMVETVQFADGVGTLLADAQLVVLEVGPGQALGSFIRQHPACGRDRFGQIVATVRGMTDPSDDLDVLLSALGRLWLHDVVVDWAGFRGSEVRQRIPLPTYPFERQRFWIELPPNPRGDSGRKVRRFDAGDWYAVPSWKRAVAHDELIDGAAGLGDQGSWLVLADGEGLAAELTAWLEERGQIVITVTPGAAFAQQDAAAYTVRAGSREDFTALLQTLERQGQTPGRVVHAWLATPEVGAAQLNDAELAESLDLGFYSLLALAQALGEQDIEWCEINVLTSEMHDINGREHLNVAAAAVIGPCKIIPVEYPNLTARSIDILLPASPAERATLVAQLGTELATPPIGDLVAFRGAHRWVQMMEPVALPAAPASHPRLRTGGVYLLTGGLGGIALGLARDLAATLQAKLVLVNRSGLPDRDTWPALLERNGAEQGVGRRIQQVLDLEVLGAEVLVIQADVTDAVAMTAAVNQAQARFGTIHGVLHTAGVPGVGLMQLKDAATAAAELAPKVQGTLALTQALAGVPLDFLALFSSVTSATGGGPGQVAYCAANAFLDAYARKHAADHGRTVAVSWGEWLWDAWSDGLQGFSAEDQLRFRAYRRTFGITFDEGAEALRRILACRIPHLFVTTEDVVAMFEDSKGSALRRAARQEDAAQRYPRPEVSTSFVEPQSELEQQVSAIWSEVLGIAPIGVNDNFFDLGGNSLIGIQIVTRLRRTFQVALPLTILFDAPTVEEMSIAIEMMLIDAIEHASESAAKSVSLI